MFFFAQAEVFPSAGLEIPFASSFLRVSGCVSEKKNKTEIKTEFSLRERW